MRKALLTLALTLPALAACGPTMARSAVEIGMTSAYRPVVPAAAPAPGSPAPAYELLAGDLHCHVRPPDGEGEVSRDVPETVALARKEKLDFVVLTPHVAARFFQSAPARAHVLASRAELREALARAGDGRTTFILGMEYTDHRWGHVGASFADLEAVLADVPADEADRHPERFFERFVARGGLLVLNHPLVTPLDSPIAIARADLSFRPFTTKGPFPAEIQAVDRLAQGVEAFNLIAAQLRDRFLVGDTLHTIRATFALLDREIPLRARRMTPVGGSDSHGHFLRATTFVLSRGRSEAEIREAIVSGRTCVRSPEACSFEVRPRGGAWAGVGASLRAREIEARARGKDVEIFVDGHPAGAPAEGAVVRATLDETRCAVARARVGDGYSAPIYLNCPFD